MGNLGLDPIVSVYLCVWWVVLYCHIDQYFLHKNPFSYFYFHIILINRMNHDFYHYNDLKPYLTLLRRLIILTDQHKLGNLLIFCIYDLNVYIYLY